MSIREVAGKDSPNRSWPEDQARRQSLVGRKSVLMGMLTAGFVVANAAQASTATAGTVKPGTIAASQSTYVLRWTPSTAYTIGQQITSPNNDVVTANASHTSSSAYASDIARWTLSSTFAGAVLVSAFGAKADGTTDDSLSIRAAITAAAALAGSTGRQAVVQLMAGIHAVTFLPSTNVSGYIQAIELPPNVHLRGMGIGATSIRLIAGSNPGSSSAAIIRNRTLNGGGDQNISLSHFEVDGQGAINQSLIQGVAFVRARSIHVSNVRVRNVYGTAPYPPGETFHFTTDSCVDVTYTDCECIGDSGTQGSGFADNSSTNIRYVGCTARGMSAGMGFASWHSANVSFAACLAYKNGTHGFNVEFGRDVTFVGCLAGGEASDQAAGYFLANDASLGNVASGFVINASQRATLVGCTSRKNDTGISIVNSGTTASSASIVGGSFTHNVTFGVYFGDGASSRQSRVSADVLVTDNGTSAWNINDGVIGYVGGATVVITPAFPASGAVVSNPYPFDVTTYVAGAASSITVGGSIVGVTSGAIHLHAGSTIQMSYVTAPKWVWHRS
jgi:hypothetical protein